MRANQKVPSRHFEGDTTRNYTPYNWQTVRADAFMLAVDGDATGNRVAPARSACAVLVGSQNANREWVYSQQQTVSAEGFSGIAFSTHVPHTVRLKETKNCTDCHVSRDGDNNALMAQLLMQGTGAMNFMFRWVYVGTTYGVEAVVVTERDEPQAVIGSTLHEVAYPDFFQAHLDRGRRLPGGFVNHVAHASNGVRALQLRGEYVYLADGPGGLRVFDVAQIDQKGFSERITTAPVSPLDQRRFVLTASRAPARATCSCSSARGTGGAREVALPCRTSGARRPARRSRAAPRRARRARASRRAQCRCPRRAHATCGART
jgi:hypothetical protein